MTTRDVDVAPGVSAFVALPAVPDGRGIVVLMEAFGLNAFVRETCRRFARSGYAACAPDLYRGNVYDYAERDRAIGHLHKLDDAQMMREVGGALDVLDREGAKRNGIIGFCMGGRAGFLANATHGARLRASVSFYGGGIAPAEPKGRKPLLDRVPDLGAPQLLVYGAKDGSIAPDEHARLAQALTAANKRYTLAVLPDAPHLRHFRSRQLPRGAGESRMAHDVRIPRRGTGAAGRPLNRRDGRSPYHHGLQVGNHREKAEWTAGSPARPRSSRRPDRASAAPAPSPWRARARRCSPPT